MILPSGRRWKLVSKDRAPVAALLGSTQDTHCDIIAHSCVMRQPTTAAAGVSAGENCRTTPQAPGTHYYCVSIPYRPLLSFLLRGFYAVGAACCCVLRQRAEDDDKGTQDKAVKHEEESEPRKAFSAAPTFEEFLKFKQAERGETELKIP